MATAIPAALHDGDQGLDVRALQATLRALGFDEAVRAFQNAHGLDVDGIVGAETRHAIASVSRDGQALPTGVDATAAPGAFGSLDRLLAAARSDDVDAFRAVLDDFSDTAFGRHFQAARAERTADLEPQPQAEHTVQDALQR